jgi:alcohol dehydrogenase class IV
MTPILGETQGGRKTTQRSAKIQPEVVVYDVDLTLTLPPKMSALSAFNAVAHAVEALYAPDGNPIVSMMAEEGVRAIAGSVREVMHDPGNAHARAALLYGAWLCACCLGTTSMGLHHKLCHVLGGLFDLPHAQTHAIVLPYVLEYNAPSAPHAMDRLTRAFGTPHVVEYLLSLERECDIPLALGGIGMPHEGVRLAAEEAVTSSYSNPRSFDRESVTALLERAWAGSGV